MANSQDVGGLSKKGPQITVVASQQDEDAIVTTAAMKEPVEVVTYWSLPHKRQLAILMFARFAEPLAASSVQSYVFFQLQHLSPNASAEEITVQIGLLFSSKMAAHVCTAIIWGRLADASFGGRKPVLTFGLLASTIALLGYGFSTTFRAALMWQVLEGALNCTTSMVRCVTAELNPRKKYRARALTLLPLFANAGTLIGPLIGGFLASPDRSSQQVSIFSAYPFAAPNIVIAILHAVVATAVVCGLDETSGTCRQQCSTRFGSFLNAFKIRSRRDSPAKGIVQETSPLLPEHQQDNPSQIALTPRSTATNDRPVTLSFYQMWTPNVVCTLLAQFIIAGHLGTFSHLWAVFLSMHPTPALNDPDTPNKGGTISSLSEWSVLHPTGTSGGLGFSPRGVGTIISLLGTFGILLQVMIYPILNDRLGTIRLWRAGLFVFPVAYVLAPFCSIAIPASFRDSPADSPLVWSMVLIVILLFVAGRTCVTPATSLLINDCTPHSSVRGTIHTTGTLVSNLSRSIFPAIVMPIFAYGLKTGTAGLAFWFLAGLAVIACFVSMWVRDGTAHAMEEVSEQHVHGGAQVTPATKSGRSR